MLNIFAALWYIIGITVFAIVVATSTTTLDANGNKVSSYHQQKSDDEGNPKRQDRLPLGLPWYVEPGP